MRNHGSVWDGGKKIFHFLPWTHKNSTNYLKYQKNNKDIQGVQHCRTCDKKNYHACNDIKCTHCKHMKHKKCSEIQNAHNLLMQHFILHKLKILNLKNSNFTCYKKAATAMNMKTIQIIHLTLRN